MSLQKPKYYNCKIYFKDGTFSAYISVDKMNWYLKKNLCEKINDMSIRMLFDPEIKIYMEQNEETPRDNKCVTCGNESELCRYSLIPSEFIKYYPVEKKTSRSDLVIVLCKGCSYDAEYFKKVYRDALLKAYIPDAEKPADIIYDTLKRKVISIYTAYCKKKTIDEFKMKVLVDYFGKEPSIEEIESIKNMNEFKLYGEKKQNIFEYIVDDIISRNKIREFEEGFIGNFCKYMEPKYIPLDLKKKFDTIVESVKI